MKRALLIAGGTVGGLGAVLSITPPHLSSQGMTGLGIGSVTSSAGIAAKSTTSQSTAAAVPQTATSVAATTAPTPASSVTPATKKRTIKATRTKVASHKVAATASPTQTKTVAPTPTQTKTVAPTPTQTKTVAPTPTQTKTVAPTPTPTKTVAPPPASKGASGTFTGSAINVNYGIVQVQITVVNGKITDAQAIQTPTGRSGQFSTYAVPILRQETLAAQSSQIQGVSGASYTSYGWYTSLVAALAKAGM